MDYDNDGILDFLSGSYDPGDVYLFRGRGKGEYAAVEQIRDRNGVPIVHHPEELVEYERMSAAGDRSSQAALQKRVASFGSWVASVDWENDGDLDLLIGSFDGRLFRRINEGTRGAPVYAPDSVPVEVDGAPLKVHCHADPVVADWNGDGLWDLVVSSGDGSVGWYENVGSAEAPQFGARNPLVPAKAESKFLEQRLAPGDEPKPGVRAQICVVDYDLDGRPDLVLGDYSNVRRQRALDDAEREALAAAETELAALQAKLRAAGDDDKAAAGLKEQIARVTKRRDSYFLDSEARRTSHVWLYLRAPAGARPAAGR